MSIVGGRYLVIRWLGIPPGNPQAFARHSPDIPQAFPRHSPGIPQAFPRHSPGITQAFPRHYTGIPQAFPRQSPGIVMQVKQAPLARDVWLHLVTNFEES
jgi:hypothetical protein